jgi:hypothetical protein
MPTHDDDLHRDDELLQELRELATRYDPVPPAVTEFALAAYGWRRIDAELALLLADSDTALDEALAGARGSAPTRSLTFRGGATTIEVDVASAGGAYRLVGQLVPASAARLLVRHDEGTLEGAADELGRFALGPVPPGRISLRCEPAQPGAPPVETEWLTL